MAPRILRDEINWKGIGDYLSAARTLQEHGSGNTSGPRMHCQGLALELALKFYLYDRDGEYPAIHDLEALTEEHAGISLNDEERSGVAGLNKQYQRDGLFEYPSRYRPNETRVVISINQQRLERLIARIVSLTSRDHLVARILAR